MEKKCFCISCRFLVESDKREYNCKHPSNLADSFLEPNKVFKEKPEVLNKDNACKYYQQSIRETGMNGLVKNGFFPTSLLDKVVTCIRKIIIK